MRLRRWISLVAMFGVLLHAGLVVRHNAVMLNANLQQQELVAALGVICHGNGGTTQLAASDVPHVPQPSDSQSDCPICSGMVSAAALLPAMNFATLAHNRKSVRLTVVGREFAVRLVAVCPPSRGPPHSA
jgi:Protein of unknown function (DUF2946)